MKDFDKYFKTVAQSSQSTGQRPSVWHYLVLKLVDNFFVILLFLLTLAFAWYGLVGADSKDPERVKWALNAASLCLGVFLGLFAGRKV